MRELISIILPVYNAEKTIEYCLSSVLKQTYKDIELIIIDDGSTDRSTEICQKAVKEDARVHYHRQSNQGVSYARNQGLNLATGDYIQFIDSDDIMHDFMCMEMIQSLMINNSDMVVCAYENVWSNGSTLSSHAYEGSYTLSDYAKLIMKDPKDYYFGVLWNKIFKKEIIKKNNLQFTDQVSLGEDFIFVLQYLLVTKKISAIAKYAYCYIQISENSLDRKKKDGATRIYNRTRLFYFYKYFMEELGLYINNKKLIDEYIIEFAYYEYIAALWKERKELTCKEKKIRCDLIQEKCLDEFGLNGIILKIKMRIWLLLWFGKYILNRLT